MEKLIQFIEGEIKRRDMSISAFARLCDISKSQMIQVLNGNHNPGLAFIQKLAKGTNTDINYIVALIFPDQTHQASPEAQILANRIAKLPPEARKQVEAFVLGLAIQNKVNSSNKIEE
jgi:transcriptional regulator with XRE-family HTH domain